VPLPAIVPLKRPSPWPIRGAPCSKHMMMLNQRMALHTHMANTIISTKDMNMPSSQPQRKNISTVCVSCEMRSHQL
jgi:hypothetical protein